MKEGMKGFIVSVKEMHISFSYVQINHLEIAKQVNRGILCSIALEFAELIIMYAVIETYYTSFKTSW